jgi:predicted  nucleic acid-binding Zn-ribbon protein
MNDLSTNLKSKIDKLQAQQNKTIAEIEESRDNQIEALNRRLEKAIRDREEANKKLAEYAKMYEHLNKFFKNPSDGSIARERGDSRLFEVLSKVNESTINIF